MPAKSASVDERPQSPEWPLPRQQLPILARSPGAFSGIEGGDNALSIRRRYRSSQTVPVVPFPEGRTASTAGAICVPPTGTFGMVGQSGRSANWGRPPSVVAPIESGQLSQRRNGDLRPWTGRAPCETLTAALTGKGGKQ